MQREQPATGRGIRAQSTTTTKPSTVRQHPELFDYAPDLVVRCGHWTVGELMEAFDGRTIREVLALGERGRHTVLNATRPPGVSSAPSLTSQLAALRCRVDAD